MEPVATWQRDVGMAADEMAQYVESGDWAGFSQRFAAFRALLETPPAATPPSIISTTYEEARVLLDQYRQSIEETRTTVAADLRRVGRGRKAVNAYR